MNYRIISLITLAVLLSFAVNAQETTSLSDSVAQNIVNRLDENGLKQGLWKKNYPNGNRAYIAHFVDDRLVGDYKRYHTNGQLKAHIIYDSKGEQGTAELYDVDGNLIAEGFYYGEQKDSLWKYYTTNKRLAETSAEFGGRQIERQQTYLVLEESYQRGVKHGKWKHYYPSGVLYEETTFENGVENGVWRQYYPNGQKKEEAKIVNGTRNGTYNAYHPNGNIDRTGQYVNGLRHGEWRYFEASGHNSWTITYNMGTASNEDELLDRYEEEERQWQQNRQIIKEPAEFLNDPDGYLRNSYDNN